MLHTVRINFSYVAMLYPQHFYLVFTLDSHASQDIFRIILSDLAHTIASERSKKDVVISIDASPLVRYTVHIIESFSLVKSPLILCEILTQRKYTSAAENRLQSLFQLLISAQDSPLAEILRQSSVSIVTSIIHELSFLPESLLTVLLQPLLCQETSPKAFGLASQILSELSTILQAPMMDYFKNAIDQCLTSHCEDDSDASTTSVKDITIKRRTIFSLIIKLCPVLPVVVDTLIPLLLRFLDIEDTEVKLEAMKTLGCIFATKPFQVPFRAISDQKREHFPVPGVELLSNGQESQGGITPSRIVMGSQSFVHLHPLAFQQWLNQSRSEVEDVRKSVCEATLEIIRHHSDPAVIGHLCDILSARLFDSDADLRLFVTITACDCLSVALEKLPISFVKTLTSRILDKRVEIRREVITGIAQAFALYGPHIWEEEISSIDLQIRQAGIDFGYLQSHDGILFAHNSALLHSIPQWNSLKTLPLNEVKSRLKEKLRLLPSVVLHCYSHSEPEIKLRVVQLLEIFLQSDKMHTGSIPEGNSTRRLDSDSGNVGSRTDWWSTRIRTRGLVFLFSCLDANAKAMFCQIQKDRRMVQRAMQTFILLQHENKQYESYRRRLEENTRTNVASKENPPNEKHDEFDYLDTDYSPKKGKSSILQKGASSKHGGNSIGVVQPLSAKMMQQLNRAQTILTQCATSRANGIACLHHLFQTVSDKRILHNLHLLTNPCLPQARAKTLREDLLTRLRVYASSDQPSTQSSASMSRVGDSRSKRSKVSVAKETNEMSKSSDRKMVVDTVRVILRRMIQGVFTPETIPCLMQTALEAFGAGNVGDLMSSVELLGVCSTYFPALFDSTELTKAIGQKLGLSGLNPLTPKLQTSKIGSTLSIDEQDSERHNSDSNARNFLARSFVLESLVQLLDRSSPMLALQILKVIQPLGNSLLRGFLSWEYEQVLTKYLLRAATAGLGTNTRTNSDPLLYDDVKYELPQGFRIQYTPELATLATFVICSIYPCKAGRLSVNASSRNKEESNEGDILMEDEYYEVAGRNLQISELESIGRARREGNILYPGVCYYRHAPTESSGTHKIYDVLFRSLCVHDVVSNLLSNTCRGVFTIDQETKDTSSRDTGSKLSTDKSKSNICREVGESRADCPSVNNGTALVWSLLQCLFATLSKLALSRPDVTREYDAQFTSKFGILQRDGSLKLTTVEKGAFSTYFTSILWNLAASQPVLLQAEKIFAPIVASNDNQQLSRALLFPIVNAVSLPFDYFEYEAHIHSALAIQFGDHCGEQSQSSSFASLVKSSDREPQNFDMSHVVPSTTIFRNFSVENFRALDKFSNTFPFLYVPKVPYSEYGVLSCPVATCLTAVIRAISSIIRGLVVESVITGKNGALLNNRESGATAKGKSPVTLDEAEGSEQIGRVSTSKSSTPSEAQMLLLASQRYAQRALGMCKLMSVFLLPILERRGAMIRVRSKGADPIISGDSTSKTETTPVNELPRTNTPSKRARQGTLTNYFPTSSGHPDQKLAAFHSSQERKVETIYPRHFSDKPANNIEVADHASNVAHMILLNAFECIILLASEGKGVLDSQGIAPAVWVACSIALSHPDKTVRYYAREILQRELERGYLPLRWTALFCILTYDKDKIVRKNARSALISIFINLRRLSASHIARGNKKGATLFCPEMLFPYLVFLLIHLPFMERPSKDEVTIFHSLFPKCIEEGFSPNGSALDLTEFHSKVKTQTNNLHSRLVSDNEDDGTDDARNKDAVEMHIDKAMVRDATAKDVSRAASSGGIYRACIPLISFFLDCLLSSSFVTYQDAAGVGDNGLSGRFGGDSAVPNTLHSRAEVNSLSLLFSIFRECRVLVPVQIRIFSTPSCMVLQDGLFYSHSYYEAIQKNLYSRPIFTPGDQWRVTTYCDVIYACMRPKMTSPECFDPHSSALLFPAYLLRSLSNLSGTHRRQRRDISRQASISASTAESQETHSIADTESVHSDQFSSHSASIVGSKFTAEVSSQISYEAGLQSDSYFGDSIVNADSDCFTSIHDKGTLNIESGVFANKEMASIERELHSRSSGSTNALNSVQSSRRKSTQELSTVGRTHSLAFISQSQRKSLLGSSAKVSLSPSKETMVSPLKSRFLGTSSVNANTSPFSTNSAGTDEVSSTSSLDNFRSDVQRQLSTLKKKDGLSPISSSKLLLDGGQDTRPTGTNVKKSPASKRDPSKGNYVPDSTAGTKRNLSTPKKNKAKKTSAADVSIASVWDIESDDSADTSIATSSASKRTRDKTTNAEAVKLRQGKNSTIVNKIDLDSNVKAGASSRSKASNISANSNVPSETSGSASSRPKRRRAT